MKDTLTTRMIVYADQAGTGAIQSTEVRDAFIGGCFVGVIFVLVLIMLLAPYMDAKQRNR